MTHSLQSTSPDISLTAWDGATALRVLTVPETLPPVEAQTAVKQHTCHDANNCSLNPVLVVAGPPLPSRLGSRSLHGAQSRP